MDSGRNAFELPVHADDYPSANHHSPTASFSSDEDRSSSSTWRHGTPSSLMMRKSPESPNTSAPSVRTPNSRTCSPFSSPTPSPDGSKFSSPSGLSLTLPRSLRLLKSRAIESVSGSSSERTIFWDKLEDPFMMEETAPPFRLHPYDFDRIMDQVSNTQDKTPHHVPHLSTLWSPNRRMKPIKARAELHSSTKTARHQSSTAWELLVRDDKAQSYLAWWLMVGVCGGKDLLPFHMDKQDSQRPMLNFIVAICGHKQKLWRTLTVHSKRLLYSKNKFAFTEPPEFIRFLRCVGPSNMLWLNFRDSLRISNCFFDLDRRNHLPQLWVHCRIGELLMALKDSQQDVHVDSIKHSDSLVSFSLSRDPRPVVSTGNDLWEAVVAIHDILNGFGAMEDSLIAINELDQARVSVEKRQVNKVERVGLHPPSNSPIQKSPPSHLVECCRTYRKTLNARLPRGSISPLTDSESPNSSEELSRTKNNDCHLYGHTIARSAAREDTKMLAIQEGEPLRACTVNKTSGIGSMFELKARQHPADVLT